MTWTILLPIIIQKGIPYAFELWKIITSHPEPTPEAWEKLLELNRKTYDDYISEAEKKKAADTK